MAGRGSRAVLGVQLFDRSLESHADVVLLDRGAQGEVDYRFRLGWVDELNRPAGEKEPSAVENDISLAQDGPTEDDRLRDGAAYLEVRRAANSERSADHVHITGRAHGEIERDVLAEAMRRRSLNTTGELVDEFPEIKGICKRKVGQVYRSPEGGSLWGARKSQICINAFAQSLEVQHSDALSCQTNIETDVWAKRNSALRSYCSSAHCAFKFGDIDSIVVTASVPLACCRPTGKSADEKLASTISMLPPRSRPFEPKEFMLNFT